MPPPSDPPPPFPAALMAAHTAAAARAFLATASWDDAQAAWMEEQLVHAANTLTPPASGGFSAAVAAAAADVDRVVRGGLAGPGWPGGATAPGRAGGRAGRLPPLPPCTKLRLVPYGSTAAGLASPGGDCDLSLAGTVTVPWDAVDPEAAARDPALRSELELSSRAPDGQITCDVADLAPRAKATLLLSLVRRLEARRLVAGRAHLLLHARVPIARVVHVSTGVELDLSASGVRAAAKMEAVGALAAAGPPVSPSTPIPLAPALVRLVKAWARAAGVGDGAAGTFNSFALSLLALHHLQCVAAALDERESSKPAAAAAAALTRAASGCGCGGRVLPALQELAGGLGLRLGEATPAGAKAPPPAAALAAAAADASARRATPGADAASPPSPVLTPPPPVLTLALGTFLARTAAALDVWAADPPRPGTSVAADVWTGGWSALLRPPGPPQRRATCACVADPVDPSDNPARTLEPGLVGRVAHSARAAAGALLDLSGPEAAAAAWEAIFTPRARVAAPAAGLDRAPLAPAAPAARDLAAAYRARAVEAGVAALEGALAGVGVSPAQAAALERLGLGDAVGAAGTAAPAPAVVPPSPPPHSDDGEQAGGEGGGDDGDSWTESSSEWTEASTPPESEVEGEVPAGMAVA